MAITTSTDETADDGEGLPGPDGGTDQVLTAGGPEVSPGPVDAAEMAAMIDDLEQDVAQLTVSVEAQGHGQVDGTHDSANLGDELVNGAERRWRHRLVLYDNDVELYKQAKAEGFTGKWSEVLFGELLAYAANVMKGWLVSGEIYGLVADPDTIGRPVKAWDWERAMLAELKSERDVLAHDVTVEAFVLWMKYEANGTGWNESLGKALPGYLVDCCKEVFSTEFRKWQKAHSGEVVVSALGLGIEDLAEMHGVHGHGEWTDSQETAQWQEELLEGVWSRLKNSREKTIVAMLLARRTHQEIADELGTTRKAVSQAWDRIKNRERSK